MRLLLFLMLWPLLTKAQAPAPPRFDTIRVILLGSFHYGTTTDRNSTKFPDLFSAQRQAQLERLTSQLAAQKIDQVFVEEKSEQQAALAARYQRFVAGQLQDTNVLRDEVVQIGFRVAQKAGSGVPVGIDYKQELPYPAMDSFAKRYDSVQQWPPFSQLAWPFTDSTRKLRLSRENLIGYYLRLNDLYHRQANLFDYLHYASVSTYGQDYTGAQFASSWYDRNLKIMANLFRHLQPRHKTILVLMGASHTAVLRQLLEMHPQFRVVDLAEVLRE